MVLVGAFGLTEGISEDGCIDAANTTVDGAGLGPPHSDLARRGVSCRVRAHLEESMRAAGACPLSVTGGFKKDSNCRPEKQATRSHDQGRLAKKSCLTGKQKYVSARRWPVTGGFIESKTKERKEGNKKPKRPQTR